MARVDSGALLQRPMGSASELPLDLTVTFPDAGILRAVFPVRPPRAPELALVGIQVYVPVLLTVSPASPSTLAAAASVCFVCLLL